MNTYGFHARAVGLGARGFAWPGVLEPTPKSFALAIPGSVVTRLADSPSGGYEVEIQVNRESHADALNAILAALQRAGLEMVEATVTEWTTSWIEGALLGGTGGGAIGGQMRQGLGLVIGLAVGAVLGGLGGSLKRTATTMYNAQRNAVVPGGWLFTPVGSELPAQPNLPWYPA